ncbi:MAG: shikimate dehydrogenase [Rhodospirillaceae bacterium]|nr:shikimate dehydrogenase [Rhodospirillaceae bacterium]
MTFTSAAVVAGISGWPVKHSRSPRIHNYWIKKYGIDGVYIPLPITPNNAFDAFRSLPGLGIVGLNVTTPHKETAYKAVDEVDEWAEQLKAVNTIAIRNGLLYGTNTDAYGFIEALLEAYPNWSASSGPAVVLGAGGAARAVVAALGAEGAPAIRVLNRTMKRAEKLCEDLRQPAIPIPWAKREKSIEGAKLVVNTTVLGMVGQPSLDIELSNLEADAVVVDIVYNPLETPFLKKARSRGNIGIDGLGMLLHQARPGFKEWFGTEPEVDSKLREYVLADLVTETKR